MYIPFEKNIAKKFWLSEKKTTRGGKIRLLLTAIIQLNPLKNVLSPERFSLPQSTRCNIRVCHCWAGKELSPLCRTVRTLL